jgi:formate hydrogenlyase subunit 3/multisubunit Na+/H+ antiporter MnhD subunit
MELINLFLIIVFLAITAIFFTDTKVKGVIALITVIVIGILSGYVAVRALAGYNFELVLNGTIPIGLVPVKIDALSAWFILIIDFTIITGAVYGFNYMKQYIAQKSNITLHCIAYITVHASLIGICSVQNGMAFLLLWEIMALSAIVLVIFEHYKAETLKAGINYMVQSHVSVVFLMLGFIFVAYKTHSFDFRAIADFSSQQPVLAGTVLFLCFFIGFAIKAGFVPFHTWLPYAHPAAPAHISGIMSGVIIKIGIYGILRMLLLIKTDYTTIGFIILFVSVISGVYGVMLAIIQHNLKRLLAYHSIENIGIIGIGIGIGCIGLGETNKWMAILGFSGALLHTLNHSLFKSLLFYSAGNIYQSTHTMDIERLGGVLKQMPQTAFLFLLAALAICGLPPLNGFVSEFLIYGGIYNWLFSASLVSLMVIVFTILGLVLIGGLAILCFTKAFGVVFLGNIRHTTHKEIMELSFWQLVPMYMAGILIVSIGLFPTLFLNILQQPLRLFTQPVWFNLNLIKVGAMDSLYTINWLSAGFIMLVMVIFLLRKFVNRKKEFTVAPTWGCAYDSPGPKVQYTANSFVRSYTKLAKPLLEIGKKEMEITEVFPLEKHYETHPYDKLERIFVDQPIWAIKIFIGWFTFLQNGRLQRYILYGILFISTVICIPFFIEKITTFVHFLNHL